MATARLLEHGFAATSLEAVAAEAGVAKRTLYARFPDKRALMLAVVRRLVGRWLPGFDGLLAGAGLEHGLLAAARRTLEVALSPEALALHRLVVAESERFPELAQAMRDGGARSGIEALARVLAAHRPGLDAARTAFLAEQFQHLVIAGPQARAAGGGRTLDAPGPSSGAGTAWRCSCMGSDDGASPCGRNLAQAGPAMAGAGGPGLMGNERVWGVHILPDGTGEAAIWAPSACSAVLETAEGVTLLAAAEAGWHAGSVPGLRPGTRYRFVMDGAAWPDPASRCQPDGTAGWSEVTDPSAFRWTDGGWRGRPWHESVTYELHIGTFSRDGTFLGAIAHLDHLVRLGVTVVELMPVAAFPGRWGWGYDGLLPFAPHPAYGRPDELKALVDACHARGLSVVLDLVCNHFGPVPNGLETYAPGFFTQRHKTPWGPAIAFDAPAVRAFYLQNAAYWVRDFHIDGLRMDAVQAVFDDGEVHILDELSRRVREAAPGRAVHLTLENDNNDARWLGPGRPYDAQWNDDFHHVMRVLLAGRRDGYYQDYADEPLRRVGVALTQGFSYQGEESRHRPGLIRGTRSAQLPPSAFVNFLQNHDQVGNTPFGQRLAALAPLRPCGWGAALLILAPSPPMLFMGEEWGSARPFDYFCDYPAELGEAVRNGRREEFSHLQEFSDPAAAARLADPNAAATRDACVLDWAAVGEPVHAALLALHTELLAVRRAHVTPLLPHIGGFAGSFEVLSEGVRGGGALIAQWRTEDGRVLVIAANLSEEAVPWDAAGLTVLFQLQPGIGALFPWDLVLATRSGPGRDAG